MPLDRRSSDVEHAGAVRHGDRPSGGRGPLIEQPPRRSARQLLHPEPSLQTPVIFFQSFGVVGSWANVSHSASPSVILPRMCAAISARAVVRMRVDN